MKYELTYLKIVSWLLLFFKHKAKKEGINIVKDVFIVLSPNLITKIVTLGVTVSDGFFIQEIGTPSVASDLPPANDTAVWLMEPH